MTLPEKIESRRMSTPPSGRKEFNISKSNVVDQDKHIISVRFASFGNKDSAGDILIKGCFAKSIKDRGPESTTNRKIAFLWQHDMSDPIGRILSIEEREDGAYAEIQLSNFDAVPNAKRAWHQLIDGDINQFSFGYKYIWDKVEYDEGLDAFIVKEVALYELSVVTAGCNERTEFMGAVKNLEVTLQNATSEEKVRIKNQILNILNAAEPGISPTHSQSMFEKIGKTIN